MYSDHVRKGEEDTSLKVETRTIDIDTPNRGSDKSMRKMRVEIGCFIEGLFFLKLEEEAEFLHKTYATLSNNRLISEKKIQTRKISEKREEQKKGLFKPRLNRNSEKINSSRRTSGQRVEDSLMEKGREYEMRQRQRQREKDDEESHPTSPQVSSI